MKNYNNNNNNNSRAKFTTAVCVGSRKARVRFAGSAAAAKWRRGTVGEFKQFIK